jgi:hypothetical protein
LHQLFVVAEIGFASEHFFFFRRHCLYVLATKINKTMLYFLLNVRF